MADEYSTKRIINLPAESGPAEGDVFVVDNESTGTKKLAITNFVDKSLTEEGKAADAKAVGDALKNIVVDVDETLTQEGVAAEAKTVGDEITKLKEDLFATAVKIETELTSGGYVKYTDGTITSTSSNSYTDFIDISKYKQILFKRTTSTASSPTAGVAFYDANKEYISGIQAVKSMPEYGYFDELTEAAIPGNAVYARFTGWVDTETYGEFELYGVNNIYYDRESANSLNDKYSSSINEIKISRLFYQKLCAYGNTAANLIDVENHGNIYKLSGTASTSDIRIKISSEFGSTTSQTAVDNFTNPIKLKKGHNYKLSMNCVSGSHAEGVSVSAYKAGTHSSAGTLYKQKDGCVRLFSADSEDYHIVIYVDANTSISNAEYNITLTDLTGEYIDCAETARLYSDPNYATVQCGVIIGKKIYAYESTNFGRMHVVNMQTGEKTITSIALNHGNDMTVYNGKIYVTSMEDNGRIFIIDPDSVAIDSYVDFIINGTPVVTYGITYDKVNNQFILETADGFVFADVNLIYQSSVQREYMSGATMQGFECDGYYIYVVESSRNHIDVYDYTGKWIKEITLASGAEPETLFNDWGGGWWLFTNIPSKEWYVDAINFRNVLSLGAIMALAKVF